MQRVVLSEGANSSLAAPASPVNNNTPIPDNAPVNGQQNTGSGIPGQATTGDALNGANNSNINTITGFGQPLGQPGTGGQSVAAGGLIEGTVMVNLIDSVLPAIMVLIFHKMDMRMKKTDLQLTANEKTTLSPIVQKCMDTLMINFNNPWVALLVSFGVIYSGKIIQHGGVNWLDKQKEKLDKKADEVAAKVKQADEKIAVITELPVKDVIKNEMAFEPTEDMIKAKIAEQKCSRAQAIQRLKKNYRDGKSLFKTK